MSGTTTWSPSSEPGGFDEMPFPNEMEQAEPGGDVRLQVQEAVVVDVVDDAHHDHDVAGPGPAGLRLEVDVPSGLTARADPDLLALHQRHPVVAIWDDGSGETISACASHSWARSWSLPWEMVVRSSKSSMHPGPPTNCCLRRGRLQTTFPSSRARDV